MNHEQFEQWLQLSLYGELNDMERALLERHLESCAQCRRTLQELKNLHDTLERRRSIADQDSLLMEARKELKISIQFENNRRSLWENIKGFVNETFPPGIQAALGSIGVLSIGILIGYYFFASSSDRSLLQQTSAIEAGESQISNLRFLDRNRQTGDVEFTFETMTPVRIRGNINDEQVQKVLARALVSNQNVGTRLRAVSMMGTQADQRQVSIPELDVSVKSALIAALLYDRNLGVRREALAVLKNYLPDPDIVRAFLDVLDKENNTGLKIAAINSLDLSKYENQPMNREIIETLKNTAQSDNNNYIRIKAKAALQEVQ
jgi:hypothetical protein